MAAISLRVAGAFVASALAILLAAYGAFEHYAEDLRRRQGDELLAIARAKRAQIEDDLAERKADGVVFTRRPALWSYLDPSALIPGERAMTSIGKAFDDMREAYGYLQYELVDRSGQHVTPVRTKGLPESVAAGLLEAMRRRSPVLVDIYRHGDGCLCYGYAYPVFAKGDATLEVIGAAYLEMDAIQRIMPHLTTWPVPRRTSSLVLLRRDGEDVTLLSPPPSGAVRPLTRIPLTRTELLGVRAVSEQDRLIRGAIDQAGNEVLGAATIVAGTPWILVARTEIEEADEDIAELRRDIVALALLFLGLLAAVATYFWRAKHREWRLVQEATRQRHLMAVQASSDGYGRVDREGRVLECNQALCGITGYSEAELMSLRLSDLRVERTAGETAATLEAFRRAGTARYLSRWRRKDGSLIDVEISGSFVPDEAGGSFYAFVRDMSESLQRTRQLERLNRFHRFLLRVHHQLAEHRMPAEILESLVHTAVEEGGFNLVWGGVIDPIAERLNVVAAAGEAAAYARELDISLSSSSPTSRGPSGRAAAEQRIMLAQDFQTDQYTGPWRALAAKHGIAASAACPVIVDGRAVAVLNFYSAERDHFDADIVELLGEVTRLVALAWEAGDAAQQRDRERVRRTAVEQRFQRIFEASPLAIQIRDAATDRLLSINKAHEELFGYRFADIAGVDAWWDKAYADPVFRAEIRARWRADVQRAARSGEAFESPELRVRCKDGSERVVRGSMSVVGTDVVNTWMDLTAIREGESALRDSERRFRSMVEQAVTGFLVSTMDYQIIYVNPQLASIMGWSAEEMVGRRTEEFVAPESMPALRAFREDTASDVPKSAVFDALRKDGSRITLSLRQSVAVWADRPARVSLIEDITERAKVERKAADYLRRLEGSIRSTLEAVSRMVDLRDPYTAGHERRVGQIAAAIAGEMGWSEELCRTLELVGLVHDIGKISVPAEILSKPSRLTSMEYELIKGHAQAGYDILKDVQFDDLPVAEIIGQHHERMDGSGYPRGLKGEEILPEARILAVADVLESMASHRPYRPALGLDAALAELERNRGRLYDPAAVDAVLRLVREKGYALPA